MCLLDCPSTSMKELPTLPKIAACYVTNRCTSIHCCMEVNRLHPQSVKFYLSIDYCHWTIEYGIEKLIVKNTMYDFKFNDWHDHWMKGIYRIKYAVFHKKS